jgi:hypothetical protein
MKGTLFSADFVKDTSGNLRLLELNTDTDFWSSSLAQVDFTEFFSVLSSNSIDTIDIIYKPGHSEFVNHLSHSAQSQPNITTFNRHEEDMGTIYPTAIEDADNKFILRLAYDESAIFDSTYCKNSLELHKLFVDAVEGDLVPPMYISSSEFIHDSIEPSFNSDNVPDLVVKEENYIHQPLKFYKLEQQEGISPQDIFSNFLTENYNDSDIVMNYIDSGDTSHKSIRSFNIIYGSNLDIINLTTVDATSLFSKPESISFTTGSLLNEKHYYEFTTNFPKYISPTSFGGLFEEEMISDVDGNPVQISNAQIGNSYKSFYIEGTPNTDNISVFTAWSYAGQTLPSGSYVTSSVLINSIEQPLPNNLVTHLHYGSGSFRANGGQHILIYDSIEDKIRYEEVARIIPGDHQVFKLDGTLIDITANDFEVLNEEGLSTYILDLEETDTFALHDNDINIKIVTHNCFPEGTRILLNDGTYKNIEDLTTSDVLLTYDKEQGKYGAGTAGSIRVSTQNELIYIVTENGEEIKSTPLHRFYVEEQGWSHAKDIKVGDSLFNKDGILVKVKSVESLKGEFQVYHLIDVKDNHTYFAEDVLVHNFKIISTCFSAGTRITLSNHDEKFIEDINVGDEVLGWDGEKLVPAKVIATDDRHTVGDHAERCKVLGDMPSLYTIDETGIEFTPEHPFLTKDGWKALSPDPNQEPFKSEQEPKTLKVGDEININGEWTSIGEIRVVRSNPDEKVYNITVEGVHSYLAEGIIVHNK